jgi:hypothetical protein
MECPLSNPKDRSRKGWTKCEDRIILRENKRTELVENTKKESFHSEEKGIIRCSSSIPTKHTSLIVCSSRVCPGGGIHSEQVRMGWACYMDYTRSDRYPY